MPPVFLCRGYFFDHDFGEKFVNICKLLGELGDKKTALEYMRSILEYIENASEVITKEEVREGVELALGTDLVNCATHFLPYSLTK